MVPENLKRPGEIHRLSSIGKSISRGMPCQDYEKLEDEPGVEELFESDFLGSDEITMHYLKEKDYMISPAYLGILNFMRHFGLEKVTPKADKLGKDRSLRGFGKTEDEGKKAEEDKMKFEFFKYGNSFVVVRYYVEPASLSFVSDKNAKKKELPINFYLLEPEVWIYCGKKTEPDVFNITPLVERHNKNVYERFIKDLLRVADFYSRVMERDPTYIV
jgi:hypothetical protein